MSAIFVGSRELWLLAIAIVLAAIIVAFPDQVGGFVDGLATGGANLIGGVGEWLSGVGS